MSKKLSPMKFKTFTWPHNPTIYKMDMNKNVIRHKYVDKNFNEIEDIGSDSRIMHGNGIFFGEDAYENWRKLYNVYIDKGPGTLIHPIWAPMEVVMTKLTITHNPTPNYIEYSFEFIQHTKRNVIQFIKTQTNNQTSSNSQSSQNSNLIYTVKSGDTLSQIALKYYGKASDFRKIADANKSLIKNPNLIKIGWKLTIPNPTRNV